VDPVPDPLLLRKSDSARNRTRDLWVSSQELRPLDHRGRLPTKFSKQNSVFIYVSFILSTCQGLQSPAKLFITTHPGIFHKSSCTSLSDVLHFSYFKHLWSSLSILTFTLPPKQEATVYTVNVSHFCEATILFHVIGFIKIMLNNFKMSNNTKNLIFQQFHHQHLYPSPCN
jgi:hypothetical protein